MTAAPSKSALTLKTGLASALLLKALQNGFRGVFMRAQDLFDEMYASIAQPARQGRRPRH